MYYLVFILLCLLFGYCGYVQNAIVKDRKTQYFFRVCLIILLSYNVALFSENSNDHIGYVDMYNDINNVLIQFDDFGNLFSDRHTGMEIGYLLLNKLFHSLGFTADGFLLFVSILTNTLFVLALYKFNKYPLFCILSFLSTGVYLQESNLVRQCLAISMFIYSVPWILDQKSLWKYVMFIICAGLIHTSALLMIPLAAFKYIDIDKYHYKISYYLMIFWIMSIAVKIGIIDINFLLDKISFLSYYDMYLVTENNVGIGDMTLYALLYDLCVLVYFLTFEYNKKVIYLYSILFVFGSILTNISVALPNIYRISLYFAICQTLLLSLFIAESVKLKYKHVSYISFALLLCYYLWRVGDQFVHGISPESYAIALFRS